MVYPGEAGGEWNTVGDMEKLRCLIVERLPDVPFKRSDYDPVCLKFILQ